MPDPLTIALLMVPAVLAVTVHEVAHGWVALQLGDDTAQADGRLSLNPLRHVDPIGTLAVPALLYFVSQKFFGSPLVFGWARPVPVDWTRLEPRAAGVALVAAAGPIANLSMAGGWLLLALVLRHTPADSALLIYLCEAGIMFNAAIMTINLIPIPPLDGSRIVGSLVPAAWGARYDAFEGYLDGHLRAFAARGRALLGGAGRLLPGAWKTDRDTPVTVDRQAPQPAATHYDTFEGLGLLVIALLAASGVLGRLLGPLFDSLDRGLAALGF